MNRIRLLVRQLQLYLAGLQIFYGDVVHIARLHVYRVERVLERMQYKFTVVVFCRKHVVIAPPLLACTEDRKAVRRQLVRDYVVTYRGVSEALHVRRVRNSGDVKVFDLVQRFLVDSVERLLNLQRRVPIRAVERTRKPTRHLFQELKAMLVISVCVHVSIGEQTLLFLVLEKLILE